MAVVDSIVADFRSISDGTALGSDANWNATDRGGGSNGVATSDLHDQHSNGQVIDMSNIGFSDNMYATDTLSSDDMYVELFWFPDSYDDNNSVNATTGVFLRSDTTASSGWDGYEVLFRAENGGTGPRQIRCQINEVTAGSRSTILSEFIAVGEDGTTEGVHKVAGKIVGDTITAYVDGNEVGSVTDGTFTTGKSAGFRHDRNISNTDSQPFVTDWRAYAVAEDTDWYGGHVANHVLQETANQVDNGLSGTLTLDNTATKGNLLLLWVGTMSTSNTPTITDDGTGSWTLEEDLEAGGTSELRLWSKVSNGDEDTVTVDYGTLEDFGFAVQEFAEGWTLETTTQGQDEVTTSTGTLSADPKIGLTFTLTDGATASSTKPIPRSVDRQIFYNYNAGETAAGANNAALISLFGEDLGTATTAFDPTISATSMVGGNILAVISRPTVLNSQLEARGQQSLATPVTLPNFKLFAGSDRMLLVFAATEDDDNPPDCEVSGITYGGESLTAFAGSKFAQPDTPSQQNNIGEWWYLPESSLANLTDGNFYDVVTSWTDTGPSGNSEATVHALLIQGYDATGFVVDTATGGSVTTLASSVTTTAANSLVISGNSSGTGSYDAVCDLANQRNVTNSTTGFGVAWEVIPTASTVDADWTDTGNQNRFGISTIALSPVATITRLTNTFEGGTDGVAISTGNSGGASGDAFDVVSTSGTMEYDDAQANAGSLSGLIDVVSQFGYVGWQRTSLVGSVIDEFYARIYFRVTDGTPQGNWSIMAQRDGGVQSDVQIKTDGTINLRAPLTTRYTSTTIVQANTWYRLEWHVLSDATNGHMELQIYEGANVEGTVPDETIGNFTDNWDTGTGDVVDVIFGVADSPSQSLDFWMDDLALGVAADGWIGPANPASGVTATPGVVDMPLGTPAPTVAAASNATATPGVVNMGLATPAPTVEAGTVVTASPGVVDMPLGTPAPTISAGGGVSVIPGVVDMPLGTPAPTIGAASGADAFPAAVEMTLATPPPTVSGIQNQSITTDPLDFPLNAGTPAFVGTPDDTGSTSNVLGCTTEYEVILVARDGVTFAGRVPFSELTWSRVLDEISEATVVVPDVLGGLRCNVEFGSTVEPWKFGIRIEADGSEVWTGPIVSVERPVLDGTGQDFVTLTCQDKMAWTTKRVIPTNLVYDEDDVGTAFQGVLDGAMSLDNVPLLYCPEVTTGFAITRNVVSNDYEYAYDILTEMADAAVDYFMVGSKLAVFDVGTGAKDPGWWYNDGTTDLELAETPDVFGRFVYGLFTAEAWTSRPGYVLDGFAQANDVVVPGADSGEAGFRRSWRSTGGVDLAVGLLTSVEVAPLYRPQADDAIEGVGEEAFQELADSTWQARNIAPVVISGGALSQTAPITKDTMFPGSLWALDMAEEGIDAFLAIQRLKRVDVQVRATNDGIEETVSPTLIPLGSDPSVQS